MADLRTLFEGLGYRDVRTLLNSGNVVFTVSGHRKADVSARIEEAIERQLGVISRVSVLTAEELADALRDNPLASTGRDPSRLLVMAARDAKALTRLKPLLAERWAPEALAIGARVAYLWCPAGISESRLWTAANRVLDDTGTARNLATMTKILAAFA
jgi:uncharacterized protein (DUF1697 family)